MKSIKLLAVASLVLMASGCLKAPEDTQALRTHSMVRATTVTVPRSPSAALSTMVSRASQCLDFGSHTQVVGPTMNANIFETYKPYREGNSLVVLYSTPNDPINKGFYPRVVSDVTPGPNGGATVTTYAPMGMGNMISAIHAWAAGDTGPCPKDDWF